MKIKYLQVIEMPNGEIICLGQVMGMATKFIGYLYSPKELFNYLRAEEVTD